jgi:nucleotide-binding universal stress UspA family protein
MTMFKKILVPTDGSDHSRTAFAAALEWAQRFGSELTVLYVVDVRVAYGPFSQDFYGFLQPSAGTDTALRLVELQTERARRAVEDFCRQASAAGVPCRRATPTGVVTSSVVEAAESADLVVMGRRGEHSQWAGPLLGSTLEAVVRAIHKPVLVTQEKPVGQRRVLAAFDGSRYARAALGAAAEFCRAGGLELVVLAVGEPAQTARLLDEARGLASGADTVAASGSVADCIVRTADERDCTMVAMGAYGHSLVRELIIGGVTVQVLRQARWPLLLAR